MLISLLVFFCTVILISDSCVGFIFTHRWVFAFELAERRCSAQSYNYRSIHELGIADSQCPSIVHHPPPSTPTTPYIPGSLHGISSCHQWR